MAENESHPSWSPFSLKLFLLLLNGAELIGLETRGVGLSFSWFQSVTSRCSELVLLKMETRTPKPTHVPGSWFTQTFYLICDKHFKIFYRLF